MKNKYETIDKRSLSMTDPWILVVGKPDWLRNEARKSAPLFVSVNTRVLSPSDVQEKR